MDIAKKINEVWRLLDETALLLCRTALENRFARQVTILRAQLQRAPANPAMLQEVKGALVELRKQLRLAGYDLSMGKYTLVFDGFRNDDCTSAGFKRLVLFMDGSGVLYWKTGEENHLMLASMLERALSKAPQRTIVDMHYLWFLRTKTTLILSGSATETAEDYRRLKDHAKADGLLFLSRLKGLS
ncbi:MAG: hypothetical protein LBE02_04205 [Spirochaetaceae bacterium]|jgi:hypothetical protein|nr:hypothetical protein [Spirochaetaceae bacterium]